MSQTVQHRSRLLRLAVWVVVFLVALAVAGLVFEWANVTRGMPISRVIRLVLLGVTNLIFTACLAAIAVLYF